MQSAPYTIYAVQYAQRNTNSSELFVGDSHNDLRIDSEPLFSTQSFSTQFQENALVFGRAL